MNAFWSSISRIGKFVLKEVKGRENIPSSGGFLFASNHTNYLDAVTLLAASSPVTHRSIDYLARGDVLLWKVLGKRLSRELVIMINLKEKEKSLDEALTVLRKGNIIGIFPEGKCNSSPELLRGKSGVARLALWSGSPVIPVGISGGPPVHRGLGLVADLLSKYPRSTTVRFGKPIVFSRIPEKYIPQKLLDETTDAIMRQIGALCNKSYRRD